MKLENKVAIVTGGGKGIGAEICLRLAKEGAKIVIAEMDIESGKNTQKKIIENGGDAIVVNTNVADEISVNKPMYLLSSDGHSAWVNSKALELAGINEKTNDPPSGVIERYPNSREPSGVLREDAMALVHTLLPPYTKLQFDEIISF